MTVPQKRLLEYLRKSRAEENMNTEEVLARHHQALTEYVDAHPDLVIHETYREVKSGGSLYARPEMLRLLEDAETGEYDGVLCMDLDRLSRGRMTDQGIILDTLKWSGTKIYTPDKVYDLADDLDDQMAEFKTFLSRQEWRMIRNRMQRGKQRSIAEGCYLSNAPYGYKNIKIGKSSTLEIVEHEAAFVRQIYTLYQSGMGCTSIARTINAQGAKPRRGNEFNRSTVAKIIKNPTYIGKIVWNQKTQVRKGVRGNEKTLIIYNPESEWLIYDGLHPPIIDEETYNRCRDIMQDRYKPPSNDGTIKSPLVGIVYCAKCGIHMQRMVSKTVPYLYCRTLGCSSGTKFAFAEEAVLDHLAEEMERLSMVQTDEPTETESRAKVELDTVRAELQAATAAKSRLYDFLEQGIYDTDTFRARMAISSDKITALKSRIEELEKKIETANNHDSAALAQQIKTVLDAYDAADAGGRNALLRTVIERIDYTKEQKTPKRDFKIEITYKSIPRNT